MDSYFTSNLHQRLGPSRDLRIQASSEKKFWIHGQATIPVKGLSTDEVRGEVAAP